MRSAVERAAIHAVAAMLLSAPFAARAERTPKGAAESSDPETAWLERRYHAQPSRVDDAEAAEASAAEAPAATAEVPDEASELEGRPLEHRVAAGETLSGIAARHGVRVEQLVASNPGITPDRIREGQRLVIDAGRVRTGYVVEPGDTLTRIAELHGVSVATLRRYNPDLDPDRIRPGQTVAVYAPRPPKSRSQSIGTPARGQLTHGRRLPPGPGYTIRAADRAFATDETVRGVMAAFARARREHPKAPKIAVHDLSLARGGPMNEHRSHQSGRDVDIAYPRAHCRRGSCEFERIGPKELDAALTWTLLQYWLEHELVESIFIDYRLQPPLYREAKARGATREQLARWFQYPGGRGSRHGVIRHYPKHADHMHVRFHCHPSDPECKSYRPLLLQAARADRR